MTIPAKKAPPITGPAAKAESWYARIVFAGGAPEWVFTCDGVVVDTLRRALIDRKPAHLIYANTEVIVNPEHVARAEFQKQGDA